MAIPTQFSVTSKRRSPIANPESPKDLPRIINAENQSIVDGSNILASLSSAGVDSPDNITAQPSGSIDTSVTIPALSAGIVAVPSELTALAVAGADAPDELTAQTQATTPAPSIVTPNVGTLTTPPFSLNHPRILYDNLLFSYSGVTATNGDNPELAIVPNTYQRWSFTSSSTEFIDITLPQAVDMDTFCIGAHNLHEDGGTQFKFLYSSSDTGSFTTFSPFTVPLHGANMVHLTTPISVRRLRVEVSLSPIREKHIGYISAGIALQMQRPFFNGHTPITDADVTEYYSNRTESGEIIGQQILRQGYQTSADFSNLDDTWYRSYFAPFKQAAKLRPFFFAWNLLEYPDDVGLCRVSGDMNAPMQNGVNTKRSVSIPLLGAG